MKGHPDLVNIARAVIEANLYMVLGTADHDGRPWVTPVYYSASSGCTDFYWVSSPESVHSRNIAVRRAVSIVIFDSQTPIGTAGTRISGGDVAANQVVYMRGTAEEVRGREVERGIAIFSMGSLARGGSEWAPDKVRHPSHLRLYRAAVTQHFTLCPTSDGEPCSLHGRTDDHRVAVQLSG